MVLKFEVWTEKGNEERSLEEPRAFLKGGGVMAELSVQSWGDTGPSCVTPEVAMQVWISRGTLPGWCCGRENSKNTRRTPGLPVAWAMSFVYVVCFIYSVLLFHCYVRKTIWIRGRIIMLSKILAPRASISQFWEHELDRSCMFLPQLERSGFQEHTWSVLLQSC